MTPRPPRLAEALLWRVARPHWREHLLGDLEEEFAGRARTSSRRRAQVLVLAPSRPSTC